MTVNPQIKIPKKVKFTLPELKAEANIAWGCFTYLLANGYKAEIGKTMNVAINAGIFICVKTINPPHKFQNKSFAAS